MEKIWQSIKDLYQGENSKRNHLMYTALLILPSIIGGIKTYIDKDTPKDTMLMLGLIILFLLLLSIIPGIYLLGAGVRFCQEKLEGLKGIPEINNDLFISGARILPLSIAWCFYLLVLSAVLFGLPVIPVAGVLISKPDTLTALACISFLIIMYLLFFILTFILFPFIAYVVIEFSKQEKAERKLFNPLIIVDYMKKAFKDTIIIALKYLLVSIITSLALIILSLVVTIFYGIISTMLAVLVPTYTLIDQGIWILILCAIALVQSYINAIVTFAAMSNYVEIYKNKIEINEKIQD